MLSYHLTLFGQPLLTGPAGPIHIGGRKIQALLFYLAARSDSNYSRPHLAGLLWEDYSDQEALRNLRLALHRLRAALPVWPIQIARLLAARRFEAAEQAALRGRQVAEANGARRYIFRADRILGEIRRATGQTREAHFRQAEQMFREMGMDWDLERLVSGRLATGAN